ncbi:hypothetical protein GOODEAATRI_002276, partial [Goodea atripinnis]
MVNASRTSTACVFTQIGSGGIQLTVSARSLVSGLTLRDRRVKRDGCQLRLVPPQTLIGSPLVHLRACRNWNG